MRSLDQLYLSHEITETECYFLGLFEVCV